VQDGADGVADLAQGAGAVLVASDDAARHVTVTAEELRRAVQHEPGAVFSGPLQDRGGERVVHQQRHLATIGRQDAQVDLGQGRVRRRLDHDQAGVAAQRRRDLPGRGYPADPDTEQPGVEQVIAGAVQRPDAHDVRPASGEQAPGQCRHAGRERHRRLETLHGRIGDPPVDRIPGRLLTGGEHVQPCRLGRAVPSRVAGGQVERDGVHAEIGEIFAAGVHSPGSQRR